MSVLWTDGECWKDTQQEETRESHAQADDFQMSQTAGLSKGMADLKGRPGTSWGR